MNPISIDQFAQIVGGEAVGFPAGATLRGFATDNRGVQPGDLFLAIKGERVDGHDFADSAVAAGAVGVLAERSLEVPHVLVPNLVRALANFGAHFRSQFHGPVIGITGSAGKTTTKELVAAALSSIGPVLKTEGNRNTEYTAPLLWAELQPDTRTVVVEMAMRGFGQIAHLAAFSRPTIGLVTNIGYSHMEMVGSRAGVAKAKSELLEALPKDGAAVLWAEDEFLNDLRAASPCRVYTFGFSEDADCRITSYQASSWTSATIRGECQGQAFEATLPAAGRHIAVNAAAAMLVASLCAPGGVTAAAAALKEAQLPPLRMEVVELNGASVLLDTYNAAPPSMRAAIETIAELPCQGRRLAVIGEMRELGPATEEEHRQLGIVLAESGMDEVMFYGPPTALSAEEARMRGLVVREARSLEDVAEFLRKVKKGDAVLVKGSRSLELEKGVEQARLPVGAGC